MRPLNPNRSVIQGIVTCRHPHWSTILELCHLGFSLEDIAGVFNWQGPVPGLDQLCNLFMVDLRDRPGQTHSRPLWPDCRVKLVDLSTTDKPLSLSDERLRCALSDLLGDYQATIERRQLIPDPVLPATLPAELEGPRLLLDCCLNSFCMPDAPPSTFDGHFHLLRSFVQFRCDYFLPRLSPPLRQPQPERELAFAAGY